MTGFVTRYSKLIHILAALLIASMLFIAIQPGIVRAFASDENLSLTVAETGVPVNTEVNEEGFRQITYEYNGKNVEVTDNDFTNSDPVNDGEYITWMSQIEGKWQIFLHHVITGSTIQLTHTGNNVNPVVSGNKVAWEGQVDGVWQVFVFDGIRIIQVTSGEFPSLNVDIDDNVLAYVTKESAITEWKIYMYDIDTDTETLLTPDTYGSEPFLDDGRVKWTELVDKLPTRRYFQYKETPEVTIVPSVDETHVEDFTGVGESGPAEEIVIEATTESTESAEETTLVEGEAPKVDETPEITEPIEEVEESTESEEVLGTEDADQPEEVTVEDIKEELGIVDEDSAEETTEQETDSNTEEIIEETEEVVESTESS